VRVTPPVTITDAKLTSSTATEPHAPSAYAAGTTYAYGDIVKVVADFCIYESLAGSNTENTPSTSPLWWRKIGTTEDAYNVGTTYGLGDTVYSAATHRCYESLAAGNVGNPLPVLPETTTTKWLDVGPTNKWAIFDLNANTQTVCASPLTVVVAPGERINTVGLTGLKGNSVIISATSVTGGGTVYPAKTINLNTREVLGPYSYCFEPFSTLPSAVVFDIPPYSDIIITITISSTSGTVKGGACVLGTYIYLGKLKSGASNDAQNFSTVTRDLWGNATLVPRRALPKTDQVLSVESFRVNKIKQARIDLNAVPALWTGIDDATSDWFDLLAILGIYTKFTIGAPYNNTAEINLSLEEI
jgi:hypothetical protein